jgi:hypothetical protein
MGADADRVASALEALEPAARDLPWARERPWRAARAVRMVDGLVAVDLHGLSVKLGLRALEILLEADLAGGGFIVITGRGNHTGGRSKLKDAVAARLSEASVAFHPRGPGRFEVVGDAERVRRARPGMGLLFWLFVALLLLAVAVTLFG